MKHKITPITPITLITLLTLITLITPITSSAQVPATAVTSLDGKTVKANEYFAPGKPMVISFWATWCHPCVKELNAINENLPDWIDETGVEVLAVSIDDSRSTSRVAPFVKGRGWEFPVVLDPNGEFKRAMNVVNVPHTFLIDGKGKVVWQHTTYAEGDEKELYKKIKELK